MIRHSLELCLKYNIAQQGKVVPFTHNFKELFNEFNEFNDSLPLPRELKTVIDKIDFDSDGACYRYYADKVKNDPYFTYDDRIDVSDLIKQYSLINPSNGFIIGKISNPFLSFLFFHRFDGFNDATNFSHLHKIIGIALVFSGISKKNLNIALQS